MLDVLDRVCSLLAIYPDVGLNQKKKCLAQSKKPQNTEFYFAPQCDTHKGQPRRVVVQPSSGGVSVAGVEYRAGPTERLCCGVRLGDTKHLA